MDLENIFGAFEGITPEEDKYFFDIEKTQVFKLGMFKKIIWNQKSMETKMGKFLEMMPEIAEKLNFDDDAGEFVTHTRAWTYLKDFNPNTNQGEDALKVFADDYTLTACNLAIHFWEEKEHYEKCAHIKKIKDLLQNNLPPQGT